MANMKISGLPDGVSLNDNDMIEIARPGSPNASLRVSVSYLMSYLALKMVTSAALRVNGAATDFKQVLFTENYVTRFAMAASGDGTHTPFLRITVQNDDGTWLKDAITLSRSDGSIWYGGNIASSNDGVQQCGTTGNRWAQVCAATGTINTSDINEKTLSTDSSAVTLDSLVEALSDLPTAVFQWNTMIAKKGADAARYHVGYIAQAVQSALTSKGIDPSKTALWCNDALTEKVDTPVYDKDGKTRVGTSTVFNPILNADGSQKYRQGLRIDNLQAVLIEAQRRRIATLETNYATLAARVAALEAKA